MKTNRRRRQPSESPKKNRNRTHRIKTTTLLNKKLFVSSGEDLTSSMQLPIAPVAETDLISIPTSLVYALNNKQCVLFAGSGLRELAGYPSWKEIVRALLEHLRERRILDNQLLHSLHLSYEEGSVDSVADVLVARLINSEGGKQILVSFLQKLFPQDKPRNTKVYTVIKQLPFKAVVTGTFDSAFEKLYKIRAYTWQDSDHLRNALKDNQFFLLKLSGDLDRPDSLLVAPAQYDEMIASNRLFREFLETLYLSHTFLFVGVNIKGLMAVLKGLQLHSIAPARHLALVPVTGTGWQADVDLIRRRYGIHVYPYPRGNDEKILAQFIAAMDSHSDQKRTATASSVSESNKNPSPSHLKHLSLKNIGPFKTLDIELDKNWNVFLGDNGLGKSTILKAIALCLAREEGTPFASRLLTNASDSQRREQGEIALSTSESNIYQSTLEPTSSGVNVRSGSLGPTELEEWLVLGFPPVRVMTWDKSRDPRQENQKRFCTPFDFLPLINGLPDSRIDYLKDWLWSLEVSIARNEDASYCKTMKEAFLATINTMLAPLNITNTTVDIESRQVTIGIRGSVVPLEVISQGTASLIGWTGILCQRLFEFYRHKCSSDTSPLDQHAIVLIDEIDAHMHPYWQQTLVPKLKSLFRNVQFLVTTHSPLIIGGLDLVQVHKLWWSDDDRIIIQQPSSSLRGKGVAGLLTSELFGLPSLLDISTQNLLHEKRTLAAKESLSAAERTRLNYLNNQLEPLNLEPAIRDPLYAAFVRAQYDERQQELTDKGPITPQEAIRRLNRAKAIVRTLRTAKRRR